MGANTLAQTWSFAEGFTGDGFDEYLTILNPGASGTATISYFVEGETSPRVRSVPLPANSRTTVVVHDDQSATNPGGLGRLANGHATRVVTDVPVVVERPMYFRYGSTVDGGHNVMGATTLATTWSFAEGFTAPGFDEYLTILNPHPTLADTATISYFVEGEVTPQSRSVALPPNSRTTVAVHNPMSAGNPGGLGRLTAGHATLVETARPVVVERPMYFTYAGAITDGHNVMGATTTATTWSFAEGYTGTGFDEYLTIMNPSDDAATLEITYFLSTGALPPVTLTVAGNSRTTISVHGTAQGVGRGQAVAARVRSTNGVGIVVERPMYFTYTMT
jgi:hypothetical protein